MAVGENLNLYQNAFTLSSSTAEGLDAMIAEIRIPLKVLNRYADKGVHYAYILPSRRIKIKINRR